MRGSTAAEREAAPTPDIVPGGLGCSKVLWCGLGFLWHHRLDKHRPSWQKLLHFRYFSERGKCFSVWLGRLRKHAQLLWRHSLWENHVALSQLFEKTAFLAEAVSSGKDIVCPAWLGDISGHREISSCLVSGRVCACSSCISVQVPEASTAPQLARAPSKLPISLQQISMPLGLLSSWVYKGAMESPVFVWQAHLSCPSFLPGQGVYSKLRTARENIQGSKCCPCQY